MDYTIDHALNHWIREHPLLVTIISSFANWGVVAFGVAACALWLLDVPRSPGLWRRACAAGLSAAAVGLLLNQAISHVVWDRARPYEDHPHGVIPLITGSLDPSFPSDHATAAFAIAFGILFVTRRGGWLFLAWAALIGISRVLAGVHYPTDILAGALVGLGSGYFTARVAMPLLVPLIKLVGHASDPLLGPAARSRLAARTIRSATFRRRVVLIVGAALLAVFAFRLRGHLLDEMPLLALATWIGLVAFGMHTASGSGAKLL